MKRFEELLQDYNDQQQQSSRPITSYREWGKYRALQRTRRERAARLQLPHLSPKEQRQLSPKRPTFQKGLVVRLSYLSRYPNTTTTSSRTSSTPETKSSSSIQRKRRKSPKQRRRNPLRDPGDQYRLALKVKQTVFIRNTNVLCIQPCDDDDDENDEGQGGENFFSGKITNVVENHVRIHFHGMVKDADVWMTKDSDSLFLDGGPAGIPPSSSTSAEGGDSKREKVVVRRTKKAKPQRLIKRTKVKF